MMVRSLNSKPGTDWPENSEDDESEEPVLSPNGDRSITERINKQRIKMIVDTGSKYEIISSELFNPLSPKSDQHQISPCNINALLNRVDMRIMDMITQDEFA